LSCSGAVWGAVYGWEVPLWYAPEGVEAKDIYSYRIFNSFPHVGKEARTVREKAGLLEMTPMGKYEVSGAGAEAWLDRILANRVPKAPGRLSLCHLLAPRGGVLCEFTVTRLGEDFFYLVGTPRGERHDFDLLEKLLPKDGGVSLRNATLERGCFTVVGPAAREVLQPITDTDLSNDSFPWLTARSATVGLASDVRMLRVSYEGELGWELYHPICHQSHLLDELLKAGEPHGLQLVGNRAIESLRLEKSYRAMYRDMNVEHTALESGLDRFLKFDKEGFIGRDALLRQKQQGLGRRLVTLKVETVDADAYSNENVYSNGALVGRVTSGAHSHHFGHCLSMAYLDIDHALEGRELEVAVLGERRRATVIADSPYDAGNQRPRM
jgi:dimethylglycine dehydrogenase